MDQLDTEPAVILCLISGQPIANLIPLLQEKPQLAIFLATNETKTQAQRLQDIVTPRGIKVRTILIDPFNFSEVIQICDDLLAEYAGKLTLNVTGGTKITALAAFQSFSMAENSPRIMYLDTAKDRLLYLSIDSINRTKPIAGLIDVKDYLASYGLTITSSDSSRNSSKKKQGLEKLCKLLVENEDLQSTLNRAISESGNKKFANIPLAKLGEDAEYLALYLEECGVATRTPDAILNIQSEQNLFFCHGGWLEEYVFETIASLGIKGIKPLANVEIDWDGKGKKTKNELDVLFCHRNRLHIISCKTSNLDRNTEDSTKGKEALYELDSLSDAAGGIFGKAMLCSTHTLKEHTCKRAQNQNIKIIDGKKLLQLSEHLKQWL